MAKKSALTGRQSDYCYPMRWPDKELGPYFMRVYFDTTNGRPECVGVEMWGKTIEYGESLEAVTPLTAEAIRIPLGRIIDEAKVEFQDAATRWSAGSPDPKLLKAAREMRQEWDDRRRGRRPLYGPEHWAGVAEVYRDAWQAGGRPTAAVQAKFSVSKSTAAKWVAKVRHEMNLLPKTTKGKATAIAPSQPRRRTKREPRR